MSVSIVQYFGAQTGKCGYCTGTNCSESHGMHAYRLDCDDYQLLIDRGWRRCGNYCYKMKNDKTCCPCYTIKCNALEFKLTKSHKRILRRMNKFLRDGKRERNENQESEVPKNGDCDVVAVNTNASEPQPQLPEVKPSEINVDMVESLVQARVESKRSDESMPGDPSSSMIASNKSKASAPNINPPRKKAKQMRLERRQAKLGVPHEQPQPKSVIPEKTLKDFLTAPHETDKHQLKIVLVAASDAQRTCADAVYELYRKYQLVIHNDNPARLTLDSMKRFLVKSPLKLRLVNVKSDEFNRTFMQSFELYKKYQIRIHNDPPKSMTSYAEHLEHSPLKDNGVSNAPETGHGSFHQQYWLDDKLIAVGVIDILPQCISSVYFFYDPDYSFLSLGTYGSLREIDLVQTFAARVPNLKYYYMGFYIHSCPKMRYKGKLPASYLLCPETYVWFPLTDAIRSKLDEQKYQRLNPDKTAKDANEATLENLKDMTLLVGPHSCESYPDYIERTGAVSDRDTIMEYCKLVGKECARCMLYVNMS